VQHAKNGSTQNGFSTIVLERDAMTLFSNKYLPRFVTNVEKNISPLRSIRKYLNRPKANMLAGFQ